MCDNRNEEKYRKIIIKESEIQQNKNKMISTRMKEVC